MMLEKYRAILFLGHPVFLYIQPERKVIVTILIHILIQTSNTREFYQIFERS